MSVAKVGRGWSLAPSLVALEAEADRLAPGRSRRSDGSIGDAAHADRVSDHNPSGGWVHAIDLTDDPRGGFDVHAMAQRVIARRDPRIKYVISNRRIYGPGSRYGWAGGPYTGANPHSTLAHLRQHDREIAENKDRLSALEAWRHALHRDALSEEGVS